MADAQLTGLAARRWQAETVAMSIIEDVLNGSMEERAALELILRDVLSGRYPDLSEVELREIREALAEHERNPQATIPAEEVFEQLKHRATQ